MHAYQEGTESLVESRPWKGVHCDRFETAGFFRSSIMSGPVERENLEN